MYPTTSGSPCGCLGIGARAANHTPTPRARCPGSRPSGVKVRWTGPKDTSTPGAGAASRVRPLTAPTVPRGKSDDARRCGKRPCSANDDGNSLRLGQLRFRTTSMTRWSVGLRSRSRKGQNPNNPRFYWRICDQKTSENVRKRLATSETAGSPAGRDVASCSSDRAARWPLR